MLRNDRDALSGIRGGTANEIAESLRERMERGLLGAGDALPPVRALAEALDVNRNTVMAAYRQLAQAGLVVSRGRAGTHVTGPAAVAQDGFAADTVLRDVGTGNPDPARIPDPTSALTRIVGRPVLYGEPVIDRDLEAWADEWMRAALPPEKPMRLTITSGASDAIDRLLSTYLTRDDGVALEDPCFLASLNTVRLGGYRAVPVPVDDEGMTVDGLRAALADGVRAVVFTPRAQNPTGASITERRAEQLRAELAAHPYVLVIEDDHFSLLSRMPHASVIPSDHERWALVRSVSKFLGPDMCLAVTASDPETGSRLAQRLSPGTTWVSHLLQRLTHALVTDPEVRSGIEEAAVHYAERNAAFAEALRSEGLTVSTGDGLNLWVRVPSPARDVCGQLMRRGWLARPGDEFLLGDDAARFHLRLTVHDLTETDAASLRRDLLASVEATAGTRAVG